MDNKGVSKRVLISISTIILLLIVTLHQDSLFSRPTYTNSGQQGFKSTTTRNDLHPKDAELINQNLKRLVRGDDLGELESSGLSCTSETHFEQCVINKPVIFDKRSLTIYVPSDGPNPAVKKTIKPYARRDDPGAMDGVSAFHIIMQGNGTNFEPPECEFRHSAPAMVFSTGGPSDNNFHTFSEIVVPLFINSRHFQGRVEFVVIDYRPRWIRKFAKVIEKLSSYEVVDADVDETVHCFPAAVVGLRYHDILAVNSSEIPVGNTMEDFKQFLRDSFNLKTKTIHPLRHTKPKLLLLSRHESRRLLNEDKIVKLMKKMGFQVQRALPSETTYLDKFAQTVNSHDVVVAVHGAGLTNQVFLPAGAVVVQIVPLGIEWASEHYFGLTAPDMGLKYLEYKVQPNETSLYDLYGPDDAVVSDPASVWARGYRVVQDIYLNHQDFRIDLVRFRETLFEVLKLLRK